MVDGKRTYVKRFVFHTPGATHCKEMASVMYQINKLQVGEWLLEYMNSDETSCGYLADGAEAQQLERLGQVLSRRIDGKLQLMALDLNTVDSKTGEAQEAAYKQSIEEAIKLMESAGLVDERAAELLRRFMPTCACNDRAANGRKGARLVLGLADGDDDPTCAEHALVNILEEGRKAMDAVLRELMNITEAQAEGDAEKIKAMRTCVGWFSSPVCALIYQVAKYVAMCSTKGYAIGRKFLEWMEARLADVDDQSALLGHSEDVLAICGSRMYVFFLDAAPTERLLSQEGSLLTYLQEEADMGAENGGKLRASILKGASSTCMAGVRAMALICDTVFWKMIRAVKPSAEKHVLDVLPCVWPAAHSFFERAAASPSAVVDGSLQMELGLELAPVAETASQARRSARGAIDIARIRAAARSDSVVERLLAAAFAAMAKATANHAAEWLPAGLIATDGSVTSEGKLCSARITPELRAKYDALTATSTPVERLHALGRCTDDRGKRQRVDSRAGIALAIYNGQSGYLADMGTEKLENTFDACRAAARSARKETIKAQLIAAGRAKRAERDAKLSSKRARKEAKAAELERLKSLTKVVKWSALKSLSNADLTDQLKVHKLIHGKKDFCVTGNRTALVIRLQNLIGKDGNDLSAGDAGTDPEGVVRKKRAVQAAAGGKKTKGKTAAKATNDEGDEWDEDEDEFDAIILEFKVSRGVKEDGQRKGTKMYFLSWPGYSASTASWEPYWNVGTELVEEWEAALEAEAELDAEEARALEEEEDEA